MRSQPDSVHVAHHCADFAGIAHGLLVQEPEGLPAHPCRLGVAQVIALQIPYAGVPTSAVGFEDHLRIVVDGIDQTLNGTSPG